MLLTFFYSVIFGIWKAEKKEGGRKEERKGRREEGEKLHLPQSSSFYKVLDILMTKTYLGGLKMRMNDGAFYLLVLLYGKFLRLSLFVHLFVKE